MNINHLHHPSSPSAPAPVYPICTPDEAIQPSASPVIRPQDTFQECFALCLARYSLPVALAKSNEMTGFQSTKSGGAGLLCLCNLSSSAYTTKSVMRSCYHLWTKRDHTSVKLRHAMNSIRRSLANCDDHQHIHNLDWMTGPSHRAAPIAAKLLELPIHIFIKNSLCNISGGVSSPVY